MKLNILIFGVLKKRHVIHDRVNDIAPVWLVVGINHNAPVVDFLERKSVFPNIICLPFVIPASWRRKNHALKMVGVEDMNAVIPLLFHNLARLRRALGFDGHGLNKRLFDLNLIFPHLA
jgi:hypothetical protein